jgi:hypothetical protein
MDEDRRIRFLIPPLLFVASLLLGAFVDQSTRDLIVKVFVFNSSESADWPKLLIGLIAGGWLWLDTSLVHSHTLSYDSSFTLRPQ